ncbi:SORL protein, partial [Polyodon spathula]|nr:SORL protein [Polyodon spathula]
MATRQALRVRVPVVLTLYFILNIIPGSFTETLHLYRDLRLSLPQEKGFARVNAESGHLGAGSGGWTRAVRGDRERRAESRQQPHRSRRSAAEPQLIKVYGEANLNDSHNQMVVHWAGERSKVIVALARDSVGAPGAKRSSVRIQSIQ